MSAAFDREVGVGTTGRGGAGAASMRCRCFTGEATAVVVDVGACVVALPVVCTVPSVPSAPLRPALGDAICTISCNGGRGGGGTPPNSNERSVGAARSGEFAASTCTAADDARSCGSADIASETRVAAAATLEFEPAGAVFGAAPPPPEVLEANNPFGAWYPIVLGGDDSTRAADVVALSPEYPESTDSPATGDGAAPWP